VNDPEAAAESYAQTIREIAGSPVVIDLIHLGLGPDGHTASLIPGDPVLDVTTRDVALAGIYQGRQRLTLTFPIINRARKLLWLVTGSEKSEMLKRLLDSDLSIPAGRISQENAMVLADRDAADQGSGIRSQGSGVRSRRIK
jgi:6-phosphogluconolactonase